MSRALDCPQTLRLQSAQCGMTTTRRSSLLELHNKPTCSHGHEIPPCAPSVGGTCHLAKLPLLATSHDDHGESDIRSNFLQLVLNPVAVVSAICQLIQMPLILHRCPLRAKEAAFEDTVSQVTLKRCDSSDCNWGLGSNHLQTRHEVKIIHLFHLDVQLHDKIRLINSSNI